MEKGELGNLISSIMAHVKVPSWGVVKRVKFWRMGGGGVITNLKQKSPKSTLLARHEG